MKSGVRKLRETHDASKSITAFFKSTVGVSKVNEIAPKVFEQNVDKVNIMSGILTPSAKNSLHPFIGLKKF